MKKYTHKERAINFCNDFAEITNDSFITNLSKQSAIVALKRNIENFNFIIPHLIAKGHIEYAECIEIIRNDEKEILKEVECL